MTRIRGQISKEIGLEETRRPRGPSDNSEKVRWQMRCIRGMCSSAPLTRPHSARDWRVCDYPGALNATIANVMVNMPGTTVDDRFLNICCGSGTLMVERLHSGAARHVVGLDSNIDTLRCAGANLRESRTLSGSTLMAGDAQKPPAAGRLD